MSSYTKFNVDLDIIFHKSASTLFKRDMWVVTKPFFYYIGAEDSDEYVHVPEGFLTDGASVPRIFWGVIPPMGLYGQAAVLHDYLCEHGTIMHYGSPVTVNRKQTDHIFREALSVLGVPKWKAWMMSTAVNTYRVVTRKKKPTVSQAKILAERLIAENATKGTYELSPNQSAQVLRSLHERR